MLLNKKRLNRNVNNKKKNKDGYEVEDSNTYLETIDLESIGNSNLILLIQKIPLVYKNYLYKAKRLVLIIKFVFLGLKIGKFITLI